MSSLPGPVWAVVPARGGSKSIPLKNLVNVAGRPLLDYGVMAAKASGICDRIIGSTDDDRIAARFRELGAEVDWRPPELGGDNTPVLDVIRELLARQSSASNPPWLIVLVQPTSPFLLPSHIEGLVRLMVERRNAKSGQTVTLCPHNHHAWNQREVVDGIAHFLHRAEREKAYNKQSKPQRWVFGNLVATTATAIKAGEGMFAAPSIALPIEPPYDFDLDVAPDVKIATAFVRSGIVDLPHLA
jgi:CMP-N-acetylneuraminic acid synthetase